ncbi:MAG: 3-methyl-2-oxobutanoate hydroxymethyltransferase [Chloroflexota bacterium]|nr:MAG: 3-methyl-2-oxobutanoate hydroxymethyltransferase [Chloroflexota bacterium]
MRKVSARLTIPDILKMRAEGQPIVMLTAYDAVSARLAEAAGVPMLLVGDTLGIMVQGRESTIPVKLEHIIYHASIVVNNTEKAFVVGDLPFMSYTISPEQALENAARLMQEAGVSAVKLEGGERLAPTIDRLVHAGIPVMAHIGLMPQSVNVVGGFRVQGRDAESARQLLRDAQAVQDAGAFAVVVESVPSQLAAMITEKLSIPTIGIGAGPHCDGEVQVFHDILGLFEGFVPRHTRQYAKIGEMIREAIAAYVRDVQTHQFPTEANSFSMKEEVLAALRADGTENGASH